MFGGRRYANPAGLFCAAQIPGIGFGMGNVTLMDFLDTHGPIPTPHSEVDIGIIPVDDTPTEPARTLARELCQAGLQTSTSLEIRKLGDQHQTSTAVTPAMVTKILD